MYWEYLTKDCKDNNIGRGLLQQIFMIIGLVLKHLSTQCNTNTIIKLVFNFKAGE